MAQPLIIQYANLLHECRDAEAKAKAFLERHRDPLFQRRAKVLNKLFRLKESLVGPRR